MNIKHVHTANVSGFPKMYMDYLNGQESLIGFHSGAAVKESFEQIKRPYSVEQRERLVSVLKEQYADITYTNAVKDNMHFLSNTDTFTVTTAHQLNLCTGPLYVIYKIITAINLSKQLSRIHPDKHFVPVFYMGTEDHDYHEINHFHLFGKTHIWDTTQEGMCGRYHTNGISDLIASVGEDIPLFAEAYAKHDTLAAATRYIIHELFNKEGLIIIDADHPSFKKAFLPVVEKELKFGIGFDLVSQTNEKLERLGYQPQAHVRDVNLFYTQDGKRDRIIKEGNLFEINNREGTFTLEQMLLLARENPAHFSPNVILRGVYQELLLPNVAFVGGPSEMCYWMQLKGLFEKLEVPFPILMPRNHVLVIPKGIQKKIEKLGLFYEDVFQNIEAMERVVISKSGDQSLERERLRINELFESILEQTNRIDRGLAGLVGAERSKALKSLNLIEQKIRKHLKEKESIGIAQLHSIKEKLFPNENLQERHDNFLNFYLNDDSFIERLLRNLDAFEQRFTLLIYD